MYGLEEKKPSQRSEESSFCEHELNFTDIHPYIQKTEDVVPYLPSEGRYRQVHIADTWPPTICRASTVDDAIEEKFIKLKDQWKSEMAHVSSTTKLVLHPAYQAIIGMGPDVVPLLLRELEQQIDFWFWALHAITQADPATPEMRGDMREMAKAWLTWGKNQGYSW